MGIIVFAFGMGGTLAEAEVIAMAAHGLSKQDIRNWTLTLGNVQLMRHLLSTFKLDSRAQRFVLAHLPALVNPDQGKAYVLEALDKLLMGGTDETPIPTVGMTEEDNTQQLLDVLLDATQHGVTMGGRTRHDIARRLVQKRQRAAERDQFVRTLDFLEVWSQIDLSPDEGFAAIRTWIADDDRTALSILEAWRHLVELLDAYDIDAARIRLQPALSRNWDYYTGIVFELHTSDARRLGGGGRYDELARLLGAEHDIPAVGFTYYADELLASCPPVPDTLASSLTVVVSSETEAAGARWSHALRQRGCTVTVSAAPSLSGINLTMQPDGSLEWAGGIYHFDAVDHLVTTLEHVNA
jgi:histidyl-tRNA synthetase